MVLSEQSLEVNKRTVKNLGKIILFLGITPIISNYAFALTSTELIENSKEYDQQIVSYRGEVVGEVMLRGNSAWINVNDGVNAIGVWTPVDLVKEIKFAGNYKYRGDRVEITGILNRACSEHGGDLDIHAQGITIFKPGYETYRPLNRSRLNLALVFFVLSLILIGLNAYLKKKRSVTEE